MIDWSDKELVRLLIFDILAITFAVWWLSRRVKSKIEEVNKRRAKRWERDEEELEQDWTPVTFTANEAVLTKSSSKSSSNPTFVQTSQYRTIGYQIQDGRRVQQWTRNRLCQAMGISLKTLTSYELDEVKPHISHMVKLNRILKCRMKY